MSSTGKPAGTVPPSSSRSSMENRPWYCDGGSSRRISSTAAGMQVGVLDDPAPLVGVAVEEDDCVADELGHGLRAGAAEQAGEAGDLVVVEPGLDAVAPVDRHLGEAGEHVVGRGPPLLLRQLLEVDDHLEQGR